jgi:hypothetical protein
MSVLRKIAHGFKRLDTDFLKIILLIFHILLMFSIQEKRQFHFRETAALRRCVVRYKYY